MLTQTGQTGVRDERLQEVVKLVRAKVAPEQREVLTDFVLVYYGQVDPEELAERQVVDLYGAALSHWNFARRREPGHARVRVFNPTVAEHGWQSTHTVIEIVNDDMPFLVDSVTMEVNRSGLTLHLIVHPLVPAAVRRHLQPWPQRRGGDGTAAGVASLGRDDWHGDA